MVSNIIKKSRIYKLLTIKDLRNMGDGKRKLLKASHLRGWCEVSIRCRIFRLLLPHNHSRGRVRSNMSHTHNRALSDMASASVHGNPGKGADD